MLLRLRLLRNLKKEISCNLIYVFTLMKKKYTEVFAASCREHRVPAPIPRVLFSILFMVGIVIPVCLKLSFH